MQRDIVGVVKTIGERLTHALKLRGIGVNEVDRRAGLVRINPETGQPTDRGSGYTSRLAADKRKNPQADIVKKIADILKVRFEWLMFGTGAIEAVDGEEEESAFAAAARASLKTARPGTLTGTEIGDEFKAAVAYWRHKISDEAIARVRAKGAALDLDRVAIGELLIAEQQQINREIMDKIAARKAADEANAARAAEAERSANVTKLPRRRVANH